MKKNKKYIKTQVWKTLLMLTVWIIVSTFFNEYIYAWIMIITTIISIYIGIQTDKNKGKYNKQLSRFEKVFLLLWYSIFLTRGIIFIYNIIFLISFSYWLKYDIVFYHYIFIILDILLLIYWIRIQHTISSSIKWKIITSIFKRIWIIITISLLGLFWIITYTNITGETNGVGCGGIGAKPIFPILKTIGISNIVKVGFPCNTTTKIEDKNNKNCEYSCINGKWSHHLYTPPPYNLQQSFMHFY